MKEIYGYNFDSFLELIRAFIEDNAIKKIYIVKLEKPVRFRTFNVNIVLGDLNGYDKSFEITCGDSTVETRFLNMIHEILSATTQDFTRNGISFASITLADIQDTWEVLI